jgi:uncharacterized protein YndB with AHSA1/START domain
MAERPLVRSVERVIAASPAEIFALLADPARHPDIDGSGTVKAVIATDRELAEGSSFTMKMDHGFRYSMRNTVIDLIPNQLIAWQTRPPAFPFIRLIGGRIWRYDLTPTEDGTLVRETWDIRQEHNRRLVARVGPEAERGMVQTLERIDTLLTGRA